MINIDRVYQRVLFIANKEQRGYITPDEFNSYADQAQKEQFESYFLKKFQVDQAPGSDEDYGDPAVILNEKISLFDNVVSGIAKGDNGFYPYPDNFYRYSHASVPGPQGFPIIIDEIPHHMAHYVNLSPLTRPTTSQPVLFRNEQGLRVFPETYNGTINLFYVRQPVSPLWSYLEAPDGEPIYNPDTSVDFEIHPGDEQDLVYKILTMAGISIKQPDISGYGQGKDQQTQATEI